MKKFCSLLACICVQSLVAPVDIKAQGAQVAERKFADFMVTLDKKDLRTLAESPNEEETKRIGALISAQLMAKEAGKKVKVRFVCGNVSKIEQTQISYLQSKTGETAKAGSITVNVSIFVEAGPSLKEKLKQCDYGRRVFVTGTLSEISMGRGSFNTGLYKGVKPPSISLSIIADDLGRS